MEPAAEYKQVNLAQHDPSFVRIGHGLAPRSSASQSAYFWRIRSQSNRRLRFASRIPFRARH